VLPGFDTRAAAGKTVVLHLGNGASMCAMEAGRSVASTMGLTAVDGLPMGTRCGALDPGVILYLMDERRMGVRAIEQLLYNGSGMLGVSGISSDMRVLLRSADPRARLAIDVSTYTASDASWDRSPRHSADSTRSCYGGGRRERRGDP
jgi:acetate kinase